MTLLTPIEKQVIKKTSLELLLKPAEDAKQNELEANSISIQDYLQDLESITYLRKKPLVGIISTENSSQSRHISSLPSLPNERPSLFSSPVPTGINSAEAAEGLFLPLSLHPSTSFTSSWSPPFDPIASSSSFTSTLVRHPDHYDYSSSIARVAKNCPDYVVVQTGSHQYISGDNQGNNLLAILSSLYQCRFCQYMGGKGGESSSDNRYQNKQDVAISADQTPTTFGQLYLCPLRPRHSNIIPLRGIVEGEKAWYLVMNSLPYSLRSVLRFNQDLLESRSLKLFIIFQLLQVLRFCHEHRLAHGELHPESILVSDELWIYLSGFQCSSIARPPLPPPDPLESAMFQWVRGELSNFDYLMELNRLAGRESNQQNPHFHPVLPWVIDFSSPTGGFRDLTKTKFRLKKGDEQLDFTYNSSDQPHHITETLSEITYVVYHARRTSLDVLKRVVRQKFIPEEYPPSMARIYKWTPDECIPEFYTDASIFCSIHKELGLDDLKIPSWCKSPEDFVKFHRAVLEGEYVSRNLHHWIDLTFGYQLSGEAAVMAKNVPLPPSSHRASPSAAASTALTAEGQAPPWTPYQLHNQGIVQLFKRPHVPRQYFQKWQPKARQRWSTIYKGESDTFGPTPIKPDKPEGEPATAPRFAELASDQDVAESENEETVPAAEETEGTSHVMPCLGQLMCFEEVADLNRDFISLTPEYRPSAQAGDIAYSFEQIEAERGRREKEEETSTLRTATSAGGALTSKSTFDELKACDMFALGCIIAEVYSGKPLFNPHTIHTYFDKALYPDLSALPSNVRSLVLKLIDRTPTARPDVADIIDSSAVTDIFECASDLPGVYTTRSFHLLHVFLNELQLRQAEGQQVSPIYVSAGASKRSGSKLPTHTSEKEIAFQQWKVQSTVDWMLAELPALCSLPVQIYTIAIPFCFKFCFQPVTRIKALQLFDMMGEKLGKRLTDKHLGGILRQLFEIKDDTLLQSQLLCASFARLVQTRFTREYFLEQYLPHLLGAVFSEDPSLRMASKEVVADFACAGLARELDEEMIVLKVILPLMSRLGKELYGNALLLLLEIGKQSRPGLFSEVLTPQGLQLLAQAYKSGTSKREQRERELSIMGGLALIYSSLPHLHAHHFEKLFILSDTLTNLLAYPTGGPLSAKALRTLLRIFDAGLRQILPILVKLKKKGSPISITDQLNMLCSKLAYFITRLVQQLQRGPKHASSKCPYSMPTCGEFLCLLFRSIKESLPAEILLQHFLYIDTLDTLLREYSLQQGMFIQPDPVSDYLELCDPSHVTTVANSSATVSYSDSATSISQDICMPRTSTTNEPENQKQSEDLSQSRIKPPPDANIDEMSTTVTKADLIQGGQREGEQVDENMTSMVSSWKEDHFGGMEATHRKSGGIVEGRERQTSNEDVRKIKKKGFFSFFSMNEPRNSGNESTLSRASATSTGTNTVDRSSETAASHSAYLTQSMNSAASPLPSTTSKTASPMPSSTGSTTATSAVHPHMDVDVVSLNPSGFIGDPQVDAVRTRGHVRSFLVDFGDLSDIDTDTYTWKFKAEVTGSLRAHSGAIVSIDAAENRGVFVTASRDTTVKVWSLGLASSSIHNPLTYTGHQYPVLDARLLSQYSEAPLYVASCDHSLHIWDVESGVPILGPSRSTSHLDAYCSTSLDSSFYNNAILDRRLVQEFQPEELRPFSSHNHPFLSRLSLSISAPRELLRHSQSNSSFVSPRFRSPSFHGGSFNSAIHQTPTLPNSDQGVSFSIPPSGAAEFQDIPSDIDSDDDLSPSKEIPVPSSTTAPLSSSSSSSYSSAGQSTGGATPTKASTSSHSPKFQSSIPSSSLASPNRDSSTRGTFFFFFFFLFEFFTYCA